MDFIQEGPVIALAVQRIDGFNHYRRLIGSDETKSKGRDEREPSLRDRFAVDGVRCALLASQDMKHSCDNVLDSLKDLSNVSSKILTLAIIKPEATMQLHKILKYMRKAELSVIGLKKLSMSQEQTHCIARHDGENHSNSMLLGQSCIALALERTNAVAVLLKLCGDEDPSLARRRDEFALRAMFGLSATANGLHASRSFLSAQEEIRSIFPELHVDHPSKNDEVCGAHRRRVVHKGDQRTLKEMLFLCFCEDVIADDDYIAILEDLVLEDFKVCNLRLTTLSTKQSIELAGALSHRGADESFRRGRCLLLALERDNALSRFQMAQNKKLGGQGRLADLVARHAKEESS
ncbi:hypothetical protein GUITHDRAFT_108131 [Guillardia theta CCMP2712]|uniref:Nucleoside diphosphate kinase-like domain-containing protein n=1 Tax=Guillardia theta (strain CCMP2712) TaxID=905079 RepID=L1JC47_GUITC|nr:hypothetical protein GUITHDRAFT_108131 [Guillardia theta CCMP2712]EKX46096.1 hypothetical protein GUITHDRAFT_108131 [Guillardia theta CCMP2712]|eukprot:XP_005833076.1 hypothetical protein GUITHDRAFT_108131 [Guillardia theta CCMP2712]